MNLGKNRCPLAYPHILTLFLVTLPCGLPSALLAVIPNYSGMAAKSCAPRRRCAPTVDPLCVAEIRRRRQLGPTSARKSPTFCLVPGMTRRAVSFFLGLYPRPEQRAAPPNKI